MKVLMFGWEFPPHISGGLGTACFGLTKSLSKLNVDISFVIPKMEKNNTSTFVNFIEAQDVFVNQSQESKKRSAHLEKFLTINSSLRPYLNIDTYQDYVKNIKTSHNLSNRNKMTKSLELSGNYGPNLMAEVVRYSIVGKQLAMNENFDIIHAHDWMTYLAAVEAKNISGKPLVVHLHASEFDRSGANAYNDIYNIEKYGLEMADQIITVSKRSKKIIINKYNINPEKITVVYNAVEQDRMSKFNKLMHTWPPKDKIVLFLGRITMQKGPEYFIEAANIVLKTMKNVRFVMAGSGDLAKKMIERMASLEIVDRFHFTGFLNENERERLFSISHLYIMPSVSEPFGITPLEAIRHNIPVIISKQSGIAEVLDHAIKIDFWDVKKLASSIIEVLQNHTLNQKLKNENFNKLKFFDWHSSAKEVLDVYQKTLDNMPNHNPN